jgi:hypothetical protein
MTLWRGDGGYTLEEDDRGPYPTDSAKVDILALSEDLSDAFMRG